MARPPAVRIGGKRGNHPRPQLIGDFLQVGAIFFRDGLVLADLLLDAIDALGVEAGGNLLRGGDRCCDEQEKQSCGSIHIRP